MSEDGCWMCESEDIVYTDILGLRWCEQDFRGGYMEDWDDDE